MKCGPCAEKIEHSVIDSPTVVALTLNPEGKDMRKGFKHLVSAALCTLMLVSGCSTGESAKTATFKAGTYTAEAKGNNGPVTVEVEFSSDSIVSVTVKDHSETAGVSDAAINKVPGEIVDQQSLAVDTVTGATNTSNAIIEAVTDCVSQAGADPESLKKANDNSTAETVSKTADIIVIGGGGAGLSAAVGAGEEGASVIIVEKAGMLGGNTILAGGGYNCYDAEREDKQEFTDAERTTVEKLLAETPQNDMHAELIATVQKQLDEYDASGATTLFDSCEYHALQTYAGGDYVGNLELIEEYAKLAPEMMTYLEDNGLVWKDTTRTYLGALWPRSHEASNYKSGQGFIDTFTDIIDSKKLNVEIDLEVAATDFIMDGDKVVGVNAKGTDGTIYEYHADKGVVLATGGFAGNKEMRKEYDPSLLETLPTTNTASVTGDGIVMASAINANLVGMEYIQSLPVCNPTTGETMDNVGASTGMFINKEGVRFCDEAGRRDTITAAARAQTDGQFYVVINEANLMADAEGKNKNGMVIADLVEAGSTIKADTIEELAEKINVDPAVLQDTVDKFQKAFDTGVDEEFGRTVYDQYVDLSAGGPYYATLRSPAVHHTMGGVEIDTDTHVIDKDGNIITGLYAAGEVTGGIHGANRLGANAIPDALAFGRLAGQNAINQK